MDAVAGKTNFQNLQAAPANGKNRIFPDSYYDAAGNQIRDQLGNLIYTYDAESRLSAATGVTYTYDGDGKRVKKSNGTLYWTGMGSDALAETDLSGSTLNEYVF